MTNQQNLSLVSLTEQIPGWADSIFKAKGLGFESTIFHELVWDYFYSKYREKEYPEHVFCNHFGSFIDAEIKNGSIDKASKLAEQLKRQKVKNNNVRQSAMSIFEEKFSNYLNDGTSEFHTQISPEPAFFPSAKLSQSEELQLMLDAYSALKSNDLEARSSMLFRLEEYFKAKHIVPQS